MEEEPRAGPHKFIRVEVFVEVHSYFSFFAEAPFPTGGVGVAGVGGILQIAERQTTSKFNDKS